MARRAKTVHLLRVYLYAVSRPPRLPLPAGWTVCQTCLASYVERQLLADQ